MASTPPYSSLAPIYDRWMERTTVDYEQMATRCRELTTGTASPRILDLCTGTGSLAILLARFGSVVGLDVSQPMLDIAVKRANEQDGTRPEFFRADVARDVWPDGPWDLVVCTGDSLNYLNADELADVFLKIEHSLNAGGSAIFDLNTPHKLVDIFANTTYAESHDDYAFIWRNVLDTDQRHIDFEITLFRADGLSPRWLRSVEVHRQYVHELDFVHRVVKRGGLDIVAIHDNYTFGEPAPGDAERWVIVARKDNS